MPYSHSAKPGAAAACSDSSASPKAKAKTKAKAAPGAPAVALCAVTSPCAIAACDPKGSAAEKRNVSFGDTFIYFHNVKNLWEGTTARRREKHLQALHTPIVPQPSGPDVERLAIVRASRLAKQLGQDSGTEVSAAVIVASAASTCERIDGPSRWIMDTGSGFDLIGMHDLSSKMLADAHVVSDSIELHTANGVTIVDQAVPLQVGPLIENVIPLMLDSTPAVLSVGRRCVDEGYAFTWPAYGEPYLTRPDGHIVKLKVDGYVPYLLEPKSRRGCLRGRCSPKGDALPAEVIDPRRTKVRLKAITSDSKKSTK